MTMTATSTLFHETEIFVDLGDNPHRPRPGRDWLANPYRVHQRIMWAIEDIKQDERPLFRIYRDRVQVRTQGEPDWRKAFFTLGREASFMLAEKNEAPQVKVREFDLKAGQRYWFDILFCPPCHSAPGETIGTTAGGKPKRRRGKRIPCIVRNANGRVDEAATRTQHLASFRERLSGSGFAFQTGFVMDRLRILADKGRHEKQKMQIEASLITGQIEVTNPDLAAATLLIGLGTGKALGCGMLILGNPIS